MRAVCAEKQFFLLCEERLQLRFKTLRRIVHTGNIFFRRIRVTNKTSGTLCAQKAHMFRLFKKGNLK